MNAHICFILLLALTLQNCREEHVTPGTGNVQVTVNFATASDGRKAFDDFPENCSLRISLEKTDGTPVETLKEVSLLKIGEHYMSAPWELPGGDYVLTDFMVVTDVQEIIYATPKAGSPLAPLVKKPLPTTFKVRNDKIANVDVEVIDAQTRTPEEFGYISFGLDVVEPADFSLSVFAPNANKGLKFEASTAIILHENDTLYKKDLGAKNNAIRFNNTPGETYSLVVIKEGFARYTKVFKLEEIRRELQDEPFVAVLQPAFTFVTKRHPTGNYFEFTLNSAEGEILINWGDGSEQHVNLKNGTNQIEHYYMNLKGQFVSITGNLAAITGMNFEELKGATTSISMMHLPNLEYFSAYNTNTAPTLNFIHNLSMKKLDITYTNVAQLTLPQTSSLSHIIISYNTGINTNSLENIVNQLYFNAVSNNIIKGIFEAEETAPFSNETQVKCQELKSVYQWTIVPAPI